MAAQNEDTFTEEEVFQALKPGMPETEARRLAKYMADDPTSPERSSARERRRADFGNLYGGYTDTALFGFE
jgi:hypothetical protein